MSQFEFGGGGGYVAGSPFGGSANGSPGSARKAVSHSLRPVTVKQLLDATQAHTDAEWQVDGTELNQVNVVAHVVSISTQTTNNVYWLDDGTGRIEARHWRDTMTEDDDTEKTGGVLENTYVRAFGLIKSFGNKRYLNLSQIRPLVDPHEIAFHMLEAMTVTLVHARGPPGGTSETQNTASNASAYAAQSNFSRDAEKYASLPILQRRIAEFMCTQPVDNAEGVHVAAIARAVGGEPAAINSAMETLMDDGHVYSTIDESHFQLT